MTSYCFQSTFCKHFLVYNTCGLSVFWEIPASLLIHMFWFYLFRDAFGYLSALEFFPLFCYTNFLHILNYTSLYTQDFSFIFEYFLLALFVGLVILPQWEFPFAPHVFIKHPLFRKKILKSTKTICHKLFPIISNFLWDHLSMDRQDKKNTAML